MINILPAKEKKEIEMEVTGRKIFICLIFVLVSLIFFIFILSSLKIYVAHQREALESTLLAKEVELRSPEFQNFKKIITAANQDLSKIQKLWQNQILITPFFEEISSLTPSTIYFTNFSSRKIQMEEKILAEIHISGFAKNRESLFYFKQNLENEKDFKDIFFLPSSWVQPTDIDFSLSFKFVPK